MIKTNDTTYNIAKSVSDKITSFCFLKEEKVAFNKKKKKKWIP